MYIYIYEEFQHLPIFSRVSSFLICSLISKFEDKFLFIIVSELETPQIDY